MGRKRSGVPINVGRIRRGMAVRGWTFKDMGEAMGVDHSAVSQYLSRGYVMPATAKRIHDAFEAHPPIPGLEEILVLEGELEGELEPEEGADGTPTA